LWDISLELSPVICYTLDMKERHDTEKESDKTAMIIAAIFWVVFIYGMICGI